jgi:tRNA (guanine37-N1)-methyltransferase
MNLFHASILTTFPQMLPGTLKYSLAGTALAKNIWSYDLINIRDFGLTKHKKIDDGLFGGGHGLVMRPDILGCALDYAISKSPGSPIYYPSPRGKLLTQNMVRKIIKSPKIIILCGRFEGIDERVIDEYNIEEISIGDYILSGGELAALVILDTCIRLLPGVLVNQETLKSESFESTGDFEGLLEAPLYTKPAVWRSRKVPEILLSGNHQAIAKWKKERSKEITAIRRADLLKNKKD